MLSPGTALLVACIGWGSIILLAILWDIGKLGQWQDKFFGKKALPDENTYKVPNPVVVWDNSRTITTSSLTTLPEEQPYFTTVDNQKIPFTDGLNPTVNPKPDKPKKKSKKKKKGKRK